MIDSSASRPRRLLPLRQVLALCVILVAGPALARGGPETWNERMQQAEELLVAGDYKAAAKVAGPLLDDVGGRNHGEQAASALGAVMALDALAEAGVGHQRDAELEWYLAQSLKPELISADLGRYGVAGERLAPHRFDAAEDKRCELQATDPTAGEPPAQRYDWSDPDVGVEPPKSIRAPQPQYTAAARALGIQGGVMLSTLIDQEGRIQAPCVLAADSAIFVYMMSRVLDRWRFHPATRDGEPIPAYYNLVTHFRLDR